MTLPRPTIVLFDMDGTTIRHLNPGLLHFLEWLDDLGYRIAAFLSRLTGRDLNAPQIVERGPAGGPRPKLRVRRALHRIFFRGTPAARIVEPCPGIYAFLELLNRHGVRLALVSNGLGKGYGHDILTAFGLARYFEVTLFREDIDRPKPHPEPLLRALASLSRPPQAGDVVWHIGDRRKDILAALAAAEHLPCPIVPLGYGLRGAAAILERKLGSDRIVLSYPELEKRTRALLEKPIVPPVPPA